jgi:hypothetical protein
MVYQESFKIQKNSRVIITNPYGKIASVQAYQIELGKNDEGDSIPEPKLYSNLSCKNNVIEMPEENGEYYIVIDIEADEGDVWHSFNVEISK